MPASAKQRVVRVIIEGRVQGVGFRAFVAGEAEARGLKGWVRNRRDGAVEALLSGASDQVEAVTEACRLGPPGGRVDSLRLEDAEAIAAGEFQTSSAFRILSTV